MPILLIMTGELLELSLAPISRGTAGCRRMWGMVHGRLRCSADLLSKLLNRVQLNPIYRILLLCTRKLLILFACLAPYTLCAFSCGNFFLFGEGSFIQFRFNKALCTEPRVPHGAFPYRSGPFPTPKSNGIGNLKLAELNFTPK